MCFNKMNMFSGCDPSCKDCFGDGNDMCYNCATGFIMNNKKCIGNFFLILFETCYFISLFLKSYI